MFGLELTLRVGIVVRQQRRRAVKRPRHRPHLRMFGTSLIGQTLSWCPIPDPIDAWGFFLDDNPVAEVHRPSSRGVVRIETGTEVLRIHFQGVSILRAVLQAQTDEPLLLFAGSFRRGRARLYEGSEFVFFSKIDRKNGPWVGFPGSFESGRDLVRNHHNPRWRPQPLGGPPHSAVGRPLPFATPSSLALPFDPRRLCPIDATQPCSTLVGNGFLERVSR